MIAQAKPALLRLADRIKIDRYLLLIVLMVVLATLLPARGPSAAAWGWAPAGALG